MTTDPNADRRRIWRLDPPRIAAVDPGACAALALSELEDDGLRFIGVYPVAGDDAHQVLEALKRTRPDKVILETQFMGARVTFAQIRTLYRRIDNWAVICDLMGIPVEEVFPASWQAQVRGIKGKDKRDTRMAKYTEAAGVFLAERGMLADKALGPDEAAAVEILRFYWRCRGVRWV